MDEILWQLKMDARVLKYQIGQRDEKQGETQARMEGLIELIRNKKNCGRGEAAEQEPPPAPTMAEKNRACGPSQPSRFVTDAITGGHGFYRIITENGPHRSRFEQQD
jgi:hypothetical protein